MKLKNQKNTKKLSKKGDGLTINVIIIVVLALLVLVVLSFIFGGRAQIFNSSVSKTCKDLGGVCIDSTPNPGNCSDSYPVKILTNKQGDCRDDPTYKTGNLYVCCVPLGSGS
jgi:flagellar basal body-associated protein FliL